MNALMQRDRLEKVLWDVSLALKHDDGTLLHEAGGVELRSPPALLKTQMLRSGDFAGGRVILINRDKRN